MEAIFQSCTTHAKRHLGFKMRHKNKSAAPGVLIDQIVKLHGTIID